MKRHSNAQLLWEARNVAKEHGLFITEDKSQAGKTTYKVFRCVTPKNQCIGHRSSVPSLRRFVFHCAGVPLK